MGERIESDMFVEILKMTGSAKPGKGKGDGEDDDSDNEDDDD